MSEYNPEVIDVTCDLQSLPANAYFGVRTLAGSQANNYAVPSSGSTPISLPVVTASRDPAIQYFITNGYDVGQDVSGTVGGVSLDLDNVRIDLVFNPNASMLLDEVSAMSLRGAMACSVVLYRDSGGSLNVLQSQNEIWNGFWAYGMVRDLFTSDPSGMQACTGKSSASDYLTPSGGYRYVSETGTTSKEEFTNHSGIVRVQVTGASSITISFTNPGFAWNACSGGSLDWETRLHDRFVHFQSHLWIAGNGCFHLGGYPALTDYSDVLLKTSDQGGNDVVYYAAPDTLYRWSVSNPSGDALDQVQAWRAEDHIAFSSGGPAAFGDNTIRMLNVPFDWDDGSDEFQPAEPPTNAQHNAFYAKRVTGAAVTPTSMPLILLWAPNSTTFLAWENPGDILTCMPRSLQAWDVSATVDKEFYTVQITGVPVDIEDLLVFYGLHGEEHMSANTSTAFLPLTLLQDDDLIDSMSLESVDPSGNKRWANLVGNALAIVLPSSLTSIPNSLAGFTVWGIDIAVKATLGSGGSSFLESLRGMRTRTATKLLNTPFYDAVIQFRDMMNSLGDADTILQTLFTVSVTSNTITFTWNATSDIEDGLRAIVEAASTAFLTLPYDCMGKSLCDNDEGRGDAVLKQFASACTATFNDADAVECDDVTLGLPQDAKPPSISLYQHDYRVSSAYLEPVFFHELHRGEFLAMKVPRTSGELALGMGFQARTLDVVLHNTGALDVTVDATTNGVANTAVIPAGDSDTMTVFLTEAMYFMDVSGTPALPSPNEPAYLLPLRMGDGQHVVDVILAYQPSHRSTDSTRGVRVMTEVSFLDGANVQQSFPGSNQTFGDAQITLSSSSSNEAVVLTTAGLAASRSMPNSVWSTNAFVGTTSLPAFGDTNEDATLITPPLSWKTLSIQGGNEVSVETLNGFTDTTFYTDCYGIPDLGLEDVPSSRLGEYSTHVQSLPKLTVVQANAAYETLLQDADPPHATVPPMCLVEAAYQDLPAFVSGAVTSSDPWTTALECEAGYSSRSDAVISYVTSICSNYDPSDFFLLRLWNNGDVVSSTNTAQDFPVFLTNVLLQGDPAINDADNVWAVRTGSGFVAPALHESLAFHEPTMTVLPAAPVTSGILGTITELTICLGALPNMPLLKATWDISQLIDGTAVAGTWSLDDGLAATCGTTLNVASLPPPHCTVNIIKQRLEVQFDFDTVASSIAEQWAAFGSYSSRSDFCESFDWQITPSTNIETCALDTYLLACPSPYFGLLALKVFSTDVFSGPVYFVGGAIQAPASASTTNHAMQALTIQRTSASHDATDQLLQPLDTFYAIVPRDGSLFDGVEGASISLFFSPVPLNEAQIQTILGVPEYAPLTVTFTVEMEDASQPETSAFTISNSGSVNFTSHPFQNCEGLTAVLQDLSLSFWHDDTSAVTSVFANGSLSFRSDHVDAGTHTAWRDAATRLETLGEYLFSTVQGASSVSSQSSAPWDMAPANILQAECFTAMQEPCATTTQGLLCSMPHADAAYIDLWVEDNEALALTPIYWGMPRMFDDQGTDLSHALHVITTPRNLFNAPLQKNDVIRIGFDQGALWRDAASATLYLQFQFQPFPLTRRTMRESPLQVTWELLLEAPDIALDLGPRLQWPSTPRNGTWVSRIAACASDPAWLESFEAILQQIPAALQGSYLSLQGAVFLGFWPNPSQSNTDTFQATWSRLAAAGDLCRDLQDDCLFPLHEELCSQRAFTQLLLPPEMLSASSHGANAFDMMFFWNEAPALAKYDNGMSSTYSGMHEFLFEHSVTSSASSDGEPYQSRVVTFGPTATFNDFFDVSWHTPTSSFLEDPYSSIPGHVNSALETCFDFGSFNVAGTWSRLSDEEYEDTGITDRVIVSWDSTGATSSMVTAWDTLAATTKTQFCAHPPPTRCDALLYQRHCEDSVALRVALPQQTGLQGAAMFLTGMALTMFQTPASTTSSPQGLQRVPQTTWHLSRTAFRNSQGPCVVWPWHDAPQANGAHDVPFQVLHDVFPSGTDSVFDIDWSQAASSSLGFTLMLSPEIYRLEDAALVFLLAPTRQCPACVQVTIPLRSASPRVQYLGTLESLQQLQIPPSMEAQFQVTALPQVPGSFLSQTPQQDQLVGTISWHVTDSPHPQFVDAWGVAAAATRAYDFEAASGVSSSLTVDSSQLASSLNAYFDELTAQIRARSQGAVLHGMSSSLSLPADLGVAAYFSRGRGLKETPVSVSAFEVLPPSDAIHYSHSGVAMAATVQWVISPTKRLFYEALTIEARCLVDATDTHVSVIGLDSLQVTLGTTAPHSVPGMLSRQHETMPLRLDAIVSPSLLTEFQNMATSETGTPTSTPVLAAPHEEWEPTEHQLTKLETGIGLLGVGGAFLVAGLASFVSSRIKKARRKK